MVLDDQVYQATQVMPDLLQFCAADTGADAQALAPLCASLKAWDRKANLDSGMGFVHFQNVMEALDQIPMPGVWRSIRWTRNTRREAWRLTVQRWRRRCAKRCWHR